MASPSSSLNKYDLITLKNPYFLSEIKEIAQSNSFFSPVLENLYSTFIFKQKETPSTPSPLENTLFAFNKEVLKVCFAFFSKHYEYRNEFIEQAKIFLLCEKLHLENSQKTRKSLSKSDIFFNFTPFFIRLLRFLETFHSSLVLKNKDIVLFEVDESFLLFPIFETSCFLDDLSLVFNCYLKKLTPFLAEFRDEKSLLLRIYSFISFMKTLSFSQNLATAMEHFSNQKLEKIGKETTIKLTERPNLDIRIHYEDSGDNTPKLSKENYLLSASPESKMNNSKRNASLNIRGVIDVNTPKKLEKAADNFFNFVEEEPQTKPVLSLTPSKKPEITEENRRSSCKIIENSGLARNLGEGSNGFLSYVASKTQLSYSNIKQPHSDSVMNSNKLKTSDNLPMNSVMSHIYPSVRFYQKQQAADKTPESQLNLKGKEPNFESIWKPKIFVSSEDYVKLNEKLTDGLMKEIMETNNKPQIAEKKLEVAEDPKLKNKKTIMNNRPDRELSSYLSAISISKSRENIEGLEKVPSKREIFEEKKPEKKEKEVDRKVSKNKEKPKIGITEADFIKIDAKTQINEKLIHTSCNEKVDEKAILDEDLMESSNTSMGGKENKDNVDGKNKSSKNPFLDFLQVEKRDNNYLGKGKKENKKNVEDFMSMSMTMNPSSLDNRKKSRSINPKK